MKTFLKIVLWATVVFMGVAITQEWRVFFRGQEHSPKLPLDPEHKREVEEIVRNFISITRHLYQSDGDQRFAERLPASERVASELMVEIDYLKKNGRTQSYQLARLDVIDIKRISSEHSIAYTKEYWMVRTKRMADGVDADPVRSLIAHVSYELSRKNLKWQVASWDLVDPPETPETSQESTGSVR